MLNPKITKSMKTEKIVQSFCTSCGGICATIEGHSHCIECEKHEELTECDCYNGDESDNFLQ